MSLREVIKIISKIVTITEEDTIETDQWLGLFNKKPLIGPMIRRFHN